MNITSTLVQAQFNKLAKECPIYTVCARSSSFIHSHSVLFPLMACPLLPSCGYLSEGHNCWMAVQGWHHRHCRITGWLTHIIGMWPGVAQKLWGCIMECQQQVRVQDCGFSRSVLVLLEGRESVGGGRNANLSHLLEVRSAYQRVFQPTDREERRG